MRRGEIWWASLPPPTGSGPGFRRPVLIVSADSFNRSRLGTVIVAVLTTNLRLAGLPGNVVCEGRGTGLAKRSVVNASQLVTVDRSILTGKAGHLGSRQMLDVDTGLRLALGLR